MQWSNDITCTLIQCPVIDGMTYGSITYIPSLYDYGLGSQLEFGCNTHYRLEGYNILTCQSDSFWNHPLPTCVNTQCDVDQLYIEYGYVSVNNGYAHFYCDIGYELNNIDYEVACNEYTLIW